MHNIGEDWEITAEGLYVATRGFLSRRGYCCANKCRNCPYIDWHSAPNWQPVEACFVKRTRVTPKALAGAQAMLTYHEQQLTNNTLYTEEERSILQAHIAHYRLLIERWR